MRFRIIYDAQGIRVTRDGYSQLKDIPTLPDTAPYSPQSQPSGYARQFRSHPSIPLLHVSFSEDEVSAIIGLLSPYGVDPRLSEMSEADQVTRIVQSVHSSRVETVLEKLPQMIRLQDLLNGQGFDSLIAYRRAADSVDPLIENLCKDILSEKSSLAQTSKSLSLAGVLGRRRKSDIRAFLVDARLGNVPTKPFYVRASREHASIPRSPHRAIVLDRWPKQLSEEFTLRKSHTWKGASNDVLNLAWSPDGCKFAVGAAAQCDEHNMQYNRSNNLILGDYTHKIIKELPDHREPYPVANHNSSHLYMSVTAVQWFDNALYTSSYDKTVKIWDVSSYDNAICQITLQHNHKVQVMARSPSFANILATGTDSTLHLWHFDSDNQECHDLDYMAQRLTRNPRAIREADFTPSSLAWGLSPLTRDYLVAGFSGKSYYEGDACREGLLATWKIAESSLVPVHLQPNAQNIFDVKSHPFLPWFATGSSVSAVGTNGTGKDIRSLVRIYEPAKKPRCAIEFDCPALDINDVSFCPVDRFHISASCTDGITYVWDFRKPSQILHRLCHGDALNQLDEELTREQADVGVRVALWGKGSNEFITGGSDGVLRSWDILRAPEDVHVRDITVIEDEIMSGAFSPDKSTLLVGDAAGGIHILQPGLSSDPVEQLHFELSRDTELAISPDSGKAIGRNLLETGQLVQHPRYGVGKGPAYSGPYASWARPEETPNDMLAMTPLLKEIQALQLDQGPIIVPSRDGIVEQHRTTAAIRNRDPSLLKRKDSPHHRPEKKHRGKAIINLCSDEEEDVKPFKASRKQAKPPIWIDLTGETDDEGKQGKVMAMHRKLRPEESSEYEEEDYWFPDSGEINANIRYSE
jgi:WD40 repeat protein